MTENSSPNMPSDGQATPPQNIPAPEQPRRSSAGGWIIGAILIALGVIFLAQSFTSSFRLDNWWALFILIPALGSLGNAWRIYRANGRLTSAARGPLVGGLILLLVTAIFLFNLDWGKMWPAFLIIVGAGILFSAL